jgi:hypothetical protein
MSNCHDCDAKPGEFHKPGCDVERCANCGGQLISCACIYEICGMDPIHLEEEYPDIYTRGPTEEMYEKFDEYITKLGGRLPWTGEWPGAAECRLYGLWSKWGPPWIRCEPDDPGAGEDLNRLTSEYAWDKVKRTWVKP